MNTQHHLGFEGENFVASHLEKEGFTICARNFRLRGGEVDIIARKKELLVFVEVKTRHAQEHCVSWTVPYTKQRKIIQTARAYIARTVPSLVPTSSNYMYRFDVALVALTATKKTLTYFPHAFSSAGDFT